MTVPTVDEVVSILERIAPPALAEAWDNVGLLVGDRSRTVRRVMTCLTLTPASALEAIDGQADLVVTHHPMPFQPLSELTTDSTTGRLLWDLIGRQISVHSSHTAYDSAQDGINQQLALGLGLTQIEPLLPSETEPMLGAGRFGNLEKRIPLARLVERVKKFLAIEHISIVGEPDRLMERVAIACGSGGSFLSAARAKECDCLVTGETNFHTCLEAEATGVGLLLTGHFASERFAMEELAKRLAQELPQVEVWASKQERDPVRVV